MLSVQHLTEDSMVSTSATQFIWCPSFPYAYMSFCEAHVLRLGTFLEEDWETQKFPWIMPWIVLVEWHLKENSRVSTSAIQFIWRPSFPNAYMSFCEAHVLRLSILLEEDRETQKIPFNYALNYAPGAASDGKFQGKYLRYSVSLTPVFSVCIHESLWSPYFTARHYIGGRSRNTKDSFWIMRWSMPAERHLTENSMVSTSTTQFIWHPSFPYAYMSLWGANVLRLGIFLEEDRETQKIPLNYAWNYAPKVVSYGKFHAK